MSLKPVVPRRRAAFDINEAAEYYRREAGETTALAFIDALERAFRHIARHPSSGSSRYAYELDLPGLRAWRLKHFPYIVFYRDGEGCIDVWRLLHAERDIPAWMGDPDAV